METIRLKKLRLLNFKGARELEIDFDQTTNIYGDNATGKTTVFDAFTWLLFGKDSTDRKQFEIKTLDHNNVVIPKIDHEVTAILDVNGSEVEIKRVLKEKWVKKRGAVEAEFVGNETLYYWDGVPLKAVEFQSKVSGLIDEGLFKLITNPLYFNSLKWQDRREVLIRMVGELSNEDVAGNNKRFTKLLADMEGKTIEEFKKKISARKKKLNDDLKTIPTRIDEAHRGLPEELDFDQIRKEITAKVEESKSIDESLMDKSKALEKAQEEHSKVQEEIFEVKGRIQAIEFEERGKLNDRENKAKSTLNEIKSSLERKAGRLKDVDGELERLNHRLNVLGERRDALRADWEKINGEEVEFNEKDLCCPTCKRALEAGDVEIKKKELSDNHRADKEKRLHDVSTHGKQLAREISSLEERVSEVANEQNKMAEEIQVLESDLNKAKTSVPKDFESFEIVLNENEEYTSLKARLEELEANKKDAPKIDDAELQSQKREVNDQLNELRKSLSTEDTIKKGKERIEELKAEEKNLAQQISELEGTEFVIENFIKTKIEAIENQINERFAIVKFKLFDTQINGGEVECCEALVDGVPFTDLNNAARINAGLDIINTLCEHHKVLAPIFIDNRESVNRLIRVDSQVINLIVSSDKKLKVA